MRKKEDYAKGHIKKSILIQFNEENLLDVPKTSKIVLISKDDEQSKKMNIVLRSHDFNAFYLIGGIKKWTKGFYYTNISYVRVGTSNKK